MQGVPATRFYSKFSEKDAQKTDRLCALFAKLLAKVKGAEKSVIDSALGFELDEDELCVARTPYDRPYLCSNNTATPCKWNGME